MKQIGKRFILGLFIIYIAILIYLLFYSRVDVMNFSALQTRETLKEYACSGNLNIVPLHTIRLFVKGYIRHRVTGLSAFENIIGNIIMFIPFGLSLPYFLTCFRSLIRTVLFGIAILLLIETVQLVTQLGAFDVDDILLNLFGIIIGYGIWSKTIKIRRKAA